MKVIMKVSKAKLIPFYEERSIDSTFNLRFVKRKPGSYGYELLAIMNEWS